MQQRYERSEARRDTRAGHYERKLQTKAGEVKLRYPSFGRRHSRRRSSNVTGGGEFGRGGLDRDAHD